MQLLVSEMEGEDEERKVKTDANRHMFPIRLLWRLLYPDENHTQGFEAGGKIRRKRRKFPPKRYEEEGNSRETR